MLKTDSTPNRSRVIMEEAYIAAGNPNFSFTIPQPFTAAMVQGVTEVGATPEGVAQQLNQVLAENLSNNLASRVRAAQKAGVDLPTQSDMDELYKGYDFSGSRSRSTVSGSLFDRLFSKAAGNFIRKLLRKKGYQSMAAPVTIAKRGEEPGNQQISYDQFEEEVARLVDGEGPWGEHEPFINVRNELIEEARNEEAEIRRREVEAESKLSSLGL